MRRGVALDRKWPAWPCVWAGDIAHGPISLNHYHPAFEPHRGPDAHRRAGCRGRGVQRPRANGGNLRVVNVGKSWVALWPRPARQPRPVRRTFAVAGSGKEPADPTMPLQRHARAPFRWGATPAAFAGVPSASQVQDSAPVAPAFHLPLSTSRLLHCCSLRPPRSLRLTLLTYGPVWPRRSSSLSSSSLGSRFFSMASSRMVLLLLCASLASAAAAS